MEEAGVSEDGLSVRFGELSAAGKTPVFVAVDGELAGLVAVADVVRRESREAVYALRGMGLEVVMLTGDNAWTANAVARELGIDGCSRGTPGGQGAEVRELQAEGRVVAMVGDGINDAPLWRGRTLE